MTADSLRAALDALRNDNERHIEEARFTEWTVSQDPTGNVRLLLAVVDAVLALHREFRIYEECDHAHAYDGGTEGESGAVVDCGEFLTCDDGYLYSVCRECCAQGSAAGGPHQTEECATNHEVGKCWPCPTRRAIAAKLLPGETVDG